MTFDDLPRRTHNLTAKTQGTHFWRIKIRALASPRETVRVQRPFLPSQNQALCLAPGPTTAATSTTLPCRSAGSVPIHQDKSARNKRRRAGSHAVEAGGHCIRTYSCTTTPCNKLQILRCLAINPQSHMEGRRPSWRLIQKHLDVVQSAHRICSRPPADLLHCPDRIFPSRIKENYVTTIRR